MLACVGVCSFVIFMGIRISIAKKPIIFVIVSGAGSGPLVPTFGSARAWNRLSYLGVLYVGL